VLQGRESIPGTVQGTDNMINLSYPHMGEDMTFLVQEVHGQLQSLQGRGVP
jgi:hypothetical protein